MALETTRRVPVICGNRDKRDASLSHVPHVVPINGVTSRVLCLLLATLQRKSDTLVNSTIMGLSGIIFRFKAKAKSVFGEDAFDWADRSYIIDWYVHIFPLFRSTILALSTKIQSQNALTQMNRVVVGILMVLASVIERLRVYERDFSPDDSLISHKKTKQQYVGGISGVLNDSPLTKTVRVKFQNLRQHECHDRHSGTSCRCRTIGCLQTISRRNTSRFPDNTC